MHDRVTLYPAQDQFAVSVSNRQSRHAVEEPQLVTAVQSVFSDSDFSSSNVSVAIVDDATMHELNCRYLDHDWPTDVLSFVLEDDGDHLEGEIVVSADTAAASAAEIGWPSAAELLLYVIHGALHLVGYRDKSPADKRKMQAAEARILRQFALEQPHELSDTRHGSCTSRRPARRGAKL
ncbi:MAG TPA: rRNA maturation RNase YbeY [Lacipirellulaceae bacterium]